MAKSWRPGYVIAEIAQLMQRKAAAAVRSSAPRVTRKNPRFASQPVGKSLHDRILMPRFLKRRVWGVVLGWHGLGQEFLWFVRGNKGQKARPITMVPDEAKLRAAVEADAVKHFEARNRREGGR